MAGGCSYVVSLEVRAIAPVAAELEKSNEPIAELVFVCSSSLFQRLSSPAE